MSKIIQKIKALLSAVLTVITTGISATSKEPLTGFSDSKMKHIVIIGGSYSGVGTAHRLLKQAKKQSLDVPFKVTLISRDSHFYWNIAAPRAILPGAIEDSKLFKDIAEGFAQYSADQFEFILGSAIGLDFSGKNVLVARADGRTDTIDFDYLVVATGAHGAGDTPFKSRGSTEKTKEALHDLQNKIDTAKSIVIAGAGPTGVELAGELAFQYGESKKIVLLSSSPRILHDRPLSVSNTAEKQLRKLGVDVGLKMRVVKESILPDGDRHLTMENGATMTADLYIPTYGVIPNTSFVPPEFLTPEGFINVEDAFKIKGTHDAFAIGEVQNAEPCTYLNINRHTTHVANSVLQMLKGKYALAYKMSPTISGGMLLGRNSGTGSFGAWKLPSFLVASLRKTLFLEKLAGTVDGTAY